MIDLQRLEKVKQRNNNVFIDETFFLLSCISELSQEMNEVKDERNYLRRQVEELISQQKENKSIL